jgi:AcrR family transcriptional regulator
MAAPRRRLGQDKRRAELLDAVERLLQRNGPAVRVEDIVAAASAAKGTFYTCFATWDDMLEEVRARKIAELDRALAPILAAKPVRASLLADVAVTAVDFILALGGLHDVLFHSAFTQARPLPESVRPPAQIAAILRRGQQAGVYAPCDPAPMGALIFAMMHETADRIAAGADRKRSLATLRLALDRIVNAPSSAPSLGRRKST